MDDGLVVESDIGIAICREQLSLEMEINLIGSQMVGLRSFLPEQAGRNGWWNGEYFSVFFAVADEHLDLLRLHGIWWI